jgi:hypothetical protein
LISSFPDVPYEGSRRNAATVANASTVQNVPVAGIHRRLKLNQYCLKSRSKLSDFTLTEFKANGFSVDFITQLRNYIVTNDAQSP